jgi:two-component system response regulator PilR (NtrC family)
MTTKPTCLIVDDETDLTELLSITLEKMGIKTDCAATVKEAKFLLSRHNYDLCLTDMRLPDGNGLDLVKHIGLPIAVITAHGSSDNAVSALKAGAFDYLSKPISLQQLRPLVISAIKASQISASKNEKISLIGNSAAMNEVRKIIEKVSCNQAPVLITGESGTGKASAAKLIHLNSSRRDQAFVKVNCAAITEKMLKQIFLAVFGVTKMATIKES